MAWTTNSWAPARNLLVSRLAAQHSLARVRAVRKSRICSGYVRPVSSERRGGGVVAVDVHDHLLDPAFSEHLTHQWDGAAKPFPVARCVHHSEGEDLRAAVASTTDGGQY